MKILEFIAAWFIPTRILLAMVADDDPRLDKRKIPRTWLPPKWIRATK